MRVYIVMANYIIVAVFSNKDTAKAWADLKNASADREYCRVYEYVVDEKVRS